MEIVLSVIIGYGLGCFNPTYILSKIKKKDVENSGTGNLGTTNAFIHFGRRAGILVLILDFAKAILAVKLCSTVFPEDQLVPVVAGTMVIIGHIFPFYHHFKGGKGIAALGGFVLATDIKMFLLILAVGCIMALIINYGCGISLSVIVLFPLLYAYQLQSIIAFVILMVGSAAILFKHLDNVKKIRDGEEMKIWTFLKKYIAGKSN